MQLLATNKTRYERHAVNIFIPFFEFDVSLNEMEMSFKCQRHSIRLLNSNHLSEKVLIFRPYMKINFSRILITAGF